MISLDSLTKLFLQYNLFGMPDLDDNIENEWTYLGVHVSIGKQLLHMGFTDPTTIQKEAIPPAVQSRMDIIGAAETVSIL